MNTDDGGESQAKLKEAAARNRKQLLIENGEEVSEEEDEAAKAEDGYQPQTLNSEPWALNPEA